MALEVLAGPGCDSVGKEAYIADKLGPDDVVISVGRIFKALDPRRGRSLHEHGGATDGALSANHGDPKRTRAAIERIHSDRQRQPTTARQADAAEAGVSRVTVLKMTPAQACAAVRRVVSGDERIAACDEGSSGAGLVRTSRVRTTAR